MFWETQSKNYQPATLNGLSPKLYRKKNSSVLNVNINGGKYLFQYHSKHEVAIPCSDCLIKTKTVVKFVKT